MARIEGDIMKDIVGVYCGLSPENLSCDGEASQSWVAKEYRRLNALLKKLCKELGRNVSESEAFDYDMKQWEVKKTGNL